MKKLAQLDYSVLQQCMHCGLCLPTCPTYDETKIERNSPRGRIALMRSIADGQSGATAAFGDEMYFCLGCLACQTACPAGVDYATLFETARAEAEASDAFKNRSPGRRLIRALVLKGLFLRPRLLRVVGRLLELWQRFGLDKRVRRFLPETLRRLESQTPRMSRRFSHQLIAPLEKPPESLYRVGLLTGCVQDLVYPQVNRDTADALLAHGCQVETPAVQPCCGSLLAHNGEPAAAAALARRMIDLFPADQFDAFITNAGGCGSHLKQYGRLLEDDPLYAAPAAAWAAKVRDIHEWLAQIGIQPAAPPHCGLPKPVAYHASCHLCHGQKIEAAPRAVLRAVPGIEVVEIPESTWCCGSAGIYNLTHPEMAQKLLDRKMAHLRQSGASIVATGNPGCLLQLENGAQAAGLSLRVVHPVTLWAEARRALL